jgi:hypothetical protein
MAFNQSEEIYGCRGEAWNGSTGAWSAAGDHRLCDDFGNRVIAINQVQRSQYISVGSV